MQCTLCNRKPTIIACFTGFYQSPCQSGAIAVAVSLGRYTARIRLSLSIQELPAHTLYGLQPEKA